MKNFSHYITEAQNTHLQHVEDLVFSNGIKGARQIFTYLSAARDMLAGHTSKAVSFSAKWDGAPSIVTGVDPIDDKFFVAKKGAFNKVPLVYKSHAEIDRNISGGLQDLFHLTFDEFKKLGIRNGAIQGDFLFTNKSLKAVSIDGETYTTFQPNTIIYAIPKGSNLEATILRARVGIAWHTQYSGRSLREFSATFNARITPTLNHPSSIWQVDAAYHDYSGLATMTATETAHVTSFLSQAGYVLQTIPSPTLAAIANNAETVGLIFQFHNAEVKSGSWLDNPHETAKDLLSYVSDKMVGRRDLLKTARGKDAAYEKSKEIITPLAQAGLGTLTAIYQFVSLITSAKVLLVNQLDKTASTRTFIQTSAGYEVAAPEGYVAVDHVGQAVKLVDRLAFSAYNFSPDIIKGWER